MRTLTWKLLNRDNIAGSQGVRRIHFTFECPRSWESLAPTSDPVVRDCGECRKTVHLCRDVQEANAHGRAGRCIAIPSSEVIVAPAPARRVDRVLAALRTMTRWLLPWRWFRRKKMVMGGITPEPKPMLMGGISFGDGDYDGPKVGWLVAMNGEEAGRTYRLSVTTIIGKAASADIRIADPCVSDEHCRIIQTPEGFTLWDGGSETGTYCDDRRIDRDTLVDGATISVGDARFVFKTIN